MKLGIFFARLTRDNGEKFVSLTDTAPEWLRDAVQEAHSGDLPNDWIYAEAGAACDAIDDGTLTDEDAIHEHADSRVDVYTRELFQWQADLCLSSTYSNAEEEAADLSGDETDMIKRVSAIQYCAAASIARTILNAFETSQEEEDPS